MDTLRTYTYGARGMNVFPITESELNALKFWALLSLTGIGIPFLICAVIQTVNAIKRETEFDDLSAQEAGNED